MYLWHMTHYAIPRGVSLKEARVHNYYYFFLRWLHPRLASSPRGRGYQIYRANQYLIGKGLGS